RPGSSLCPKPFAQSALALFVSDLARLQCKLGISHALQHVTQSHRAGNGRWLELVAAGDHFGRDFLCDEKRSVLMRFRHVCSSWCSLSVAIMKILHFPVVLYHKL